MNNSQITCPHCHQAFEPTEAFKHELEEKVLQETQQKHQDEISKLKQLNEQLEEAKKKEIAEAEQKALEKAKQATEEKHAKEMQDQADQIIELKKRAQQAEEQELKMRKEKRELEEAKQKFEIEKQRQLDEERQKIRLEALKSAEEKNSLVLAQEKKKNEDAQKQIADLQRKLQQGSQQSQGEVLELELEGLLKKEFPLDQISEVKKGIRGADVMQQVIDKNGRNCGMILWESKNAKWQPSWIPTLKENQRQAKAQVAVLVTTETPETETYTYKDGIWIVKRSMAIPLALALRYNLVSLNFEKLANTNKASKAEILYQYITSTDFKHRIEAIVETFANMQDTIETEKRWFTAKWAKQEKQIRRIVDNTIGMRADLEGLVGNELPAIDYLELPEVIEDEKEEQQRLI